MAAINRFALWPQTANFQYARGALRDGYPPMDTRLEIQVEQDIQAIRPVQARIRIFCSPHGLESRIVDGLELAVDEILSNVIRHAHAQTQDIRCITDISTETVAIVFIDDGPPFDPLTEAPAPDLTSDVLDTPIGGLGVHIVKEMADVCHYRRSGAHNQLKITWNRTAD